MRRFLVTAAVAAAGIGGLGLAYAHAQPADPSTGPNRTEAAACRPGAGGRVVHGDLIIRTKDGFENAVVDTGKVTAISGSSISLARADGKSVTVPLTDQTKFRGQTRDQIANGDLARVLQTNGSARAVLSRKADAACSGPAANRGNRAGLKARILGRLGARAGRRAQAPAGDGSSSDSSDSVDSLLGGI